MARFICLTLICLGLALAPPALAGSGDLAVAVQNESRPVTCAEEDNVTVSFANRDVRSFRIEAAHPIYLSAATRDNIEADWSACEAKPAPMSPASDARRRITLFESPDMWVVGWIFPDFWRPSNTTVRVGDRLEKGLHLIQIWLVRTDGAEEVLALYPQDGYWRPRPMTPLDMRNTGYGSSFLVGPIEVEGRPLVKLTGVAFDPPTRTFTLDFAKGGAATVKMTEADSRRLTLDVAFDRAIDGGPFAMVRSMYVTEFNNDVARIALRERNARGWREQNIMAFDKADATAVWLGRLTPSRHNTSSPDLAFDRFSAASGASPSQGEPAAPPPKDR